MTKAGKYLKDNANGGEFVKELVKRISRFDGCKYYSEEMEHEIVLFLEEQVKPTLTDDERVILRNIDIKTVTKGYGKIKRNEYGDIVLVAYGRANFTLPIYNHLFQFIKERRRIQDRGVVRRMNKNEAWATLWNMRADYIKASECGLATKGEFKKEIEALDYAIEFLENAETKGNEK